jgi:methionyl-tRNA synthetase
MNEIQNEPIKDAVASTIKQSAKISYDDFAKVEIKAGKILSAEKIPDTDKLLKLMVDFAETVEVVDETGNKTLVSKPRQIVSGISIQFPDPSVLVGKVCMFVTNLEPRMLRGIESNGMLFALSTSSTLENPNGTFSLLEPNPIIPIGTKAK